MPANVLDKNDPPRPVRGSQCVDFWQVPDVLELAAIRAAVRDFDAQTAAVAVAWQDEQRRERRRRSRSRRRRS